MPFNLFYYSFILYHSQFNLFLAFYSLHAQIAFVQIFSLTISFIFHRFILQVCSYHVRRRSDVKAIPIVKMEATNRHSLIRNPQKRSGSSILGAANEQARFTPSTTRANRMARQNIRPKARDLFLPGQAREQHSPVWGTWFAPEMRVQTGKRHAFTLGMEKEVGCLWDLRSRKIFSDSSFLNTLIWTVTNFPINAVSVPGLVNKNESPLVER